MCSFAITIENFTLSPSFCARNPGKRAGVWKTLSCFFWDGLRILYYIDNITGTCFHWPIHQIENKREIIWTITCNMNLLWTNKYFIVKCIFFGSYYWFNNGCGRLHRWILHVTFSPWLRNKWDSPLFETYLCL